MFNLILILIDTHYKKPCYQGDRKIEINEEMTVLELKKQIREKKYFYYDRKLSLFFVDYECPMLLSCIKNDYNIKSKFIEGCYGKINQLVDDCKIKDYIDITKIEPIFVSYNNRYTDLFSDTIIKPLDMNVIKPSITTISKISDVLYQPIMKFTDHAIKPTIKYILAPTFIKMGEIYEMMPNVVAPTVDGFTSVCSSINETIANVPVSSTLNQEEMSSSQQIFYYINGFLESL